MSSSNGDITTRQQHSLQYIKTDLDLYWPNGKRKSAKFKGNRPSAVTSEHHNEYPVSIKGREFLDSAARLSASQGIFCSTGLNFN
jgi:hypothetical protein